MGEVTDLIDYELVETKNKATVQVTRTKVDSSRILGSLELLDINVTESQAIAMRSFEEFVERHLEACILFGDTLTFRFNGIAVSKKVDLSLSRDILEASKMMREGYTIEEKPAEYIQVITPSGFSRLHTLGTCTCSEYMRNKNCRHSRFLNTYRSHRRVFQKAGVVNFIS
jgi:hypothetical protein